MGHPPVFVRGGVVCADLRSIDPKLRRVSLNLPAGTSDLEIGMALASKLTELRIAGKVGRPELPGLEAPGLLFRDLVEKYKCARRENYDSDGGEAYVLSCLRRNVEELGHLSVEELSGKAGNAALEEYKRRLWGRGLSHATCRNLLNSALAVLRWGQEDERELTGPLPRRPKYIRQGKLLREIHYETWTETDFRDLREHLFDGAEHYGTMRRLFGEDGAKDYIARRKLLLSLAFYTGAHLRDLNTWRGEWLSVDVGRYERRNTKSQRCVGPACFDMPEQLQRDCKAELERRGLARFPPDEIVTCGPFGQWQGMLRAFKHWTEARWPDENRHPLTFQILRRSTVWEYTVRGWRTHEIAELLGHVDTRMVENVYRRCSMLGLISPVRVPWSCASGPGGAPTRTGKVLRFGAK